MKKIFLLLTTIYCNCAFAINLDSEIGQDFMQSAMIGCVDSAIESGISLGTASDYCNCAVTKTTTELSFEQVSEYYKYGREIENIMNKNIMECLSTLLDQPDSKDEIISGITEQCVISAVSSGARIGLASEYCKCVSEKMLNELTLEQITEYYNNGREIEKFTQECMWMLSQ
ncbi:MAG: hypothetical protein KBS86_02595 [Proteobacteria bacterium]|nr:hypothetical protein [Candidatus Enterousia scatequi]